MEQVRKSSNKEVRKTQYYLSSIEYINQHKKLPGFFANKQQREYYLKPLRIAQVIFKIGYAAWDINWQNWEDFYTKQVKKSSNKKVINFTNDGNHLKRGHGFQFKIKLQGNTDWGQRESILKRSNIAYTLLGNGAYRIRALGNYVWLVEDGLVVYFSEGKSFYGNDAKETKDQALYELERVLRKVETNLHITIRGKQGYMFTVDKQHYAEIENELARKCNNDKEKFQVVGDDGKVWLLIDYSFNQDELETVHSKKSDQDMDKVIAPHLNDLRGHYHKTGESILLTDMLKAMKFLLDDRQVFATDMKAYGGHIQTHILAIKELGKGVNELRHEVGKIRKQQFSMFQKKLGEYI